MKGHTMKKVVVGLVLALTVAACSAPTTEPVNTMVTQNQLRRIVMVGASSLFSDLLLAHFLIRIRL